MAGQSINDRLTAARYSLAGQGLAKSVCKATTEEVIGPKKKHLDYLLQCTNEPNVSIPQLANLLIERAQMQSWVIVFKALITVHHLMCYGNERFTQYLASSNCNFNLGGFLDKTGVAGHPQISYDMSTFIRRYAKYINEKAISYRSVAFDFCKVKRGKEDGTLRTMATDQLLKTLPVLQSQVDLLLDFDCTANELTNGVINTGFMLLFRDLIRLFACYNDGIINLLEKYFEMNKKQARDALDCYKKFLIRMDRVSEFLKVAEAVGMDKSEIPDLKQSVGIDKGDIPDLTKNNSVSGTKAPSSLLDALEAHLASLEGKKPPASSSATNSSKVNIKSAVSALNSTSVSFGTASSNGRLGDAAPAGVPGAATNNGTGVDELTRQAALAEEEAMYEKLKSSGQLQTEPSPRRQTDHAKNNPFLNSPGSEGAIPTNNGDSGQILDLFGASQGDPNSAATAQAGKASDDLLQLAGNPFADMLSAPGSQAAPAPATVPAQPYTNGTVAGGSFSWPAFDPFGDILKPEGSAGVGGGVGGVPAAAPLVSGVTTTAQATQPGGKLISGDLDMSLSSLVDNLNIKGPTAQKGQWSSPKAQSKTGGASWTPASITPVTGSIRPAMPGQPMPAQPTQPMQAQPGQWTGGMQMGAGFPQQPVPQQGMGVIGGGFPGGVAQPGAQPTQTTQPPQPADFDPFGAL